MLVSPRHRLTGLLAVLLLTALAAPATRAGEAVLVPAPGPGRWRARLFTGAKTDRSEALAAGATLAWSLQPGRLQAVIFSPGD